MPKMKTRRGAAKRFKLTGSGKIRRSRAYHRHNLTKQSSKRKRQLSQGGIVAAVDEARILKQIPYA